MGAFPVSTYSNLLILRHNHASHNPRKLVNKAYTLRLLKILCYSSGVILLLIIPLHPGKSVGKLKQCTRRTTAIQQIQQSLCGDQLAES